MSYKVPMPRYGATMEEGLIGEWLIHEGDFVKKGQVIFSVEIEKLTNEVESPVSGHIEKILAAEGDTIACGDPVCIIETDEVAHDQNRVHPGDSELVSPPDSTAVPIPEQPVKESDKAGTKQPNSKSFSKKPSPVGKQTITPKALQLAEELQVDSSQIPGSGRYGMITREDVRAWSLSGHQGAKLSAENGKEVESAGGSAAKLQQQTQIPTGELKGARKIIAQRMMESLTHSAQAALWMDADITELLQQYMNIKPLLRAKGIKLSLTALIIKAVAAALEKHPVCRTQIDSDGKVVLKTDMHVAVAVDTPAGLMVPVLTHADIKSVTQISSELSSLVDSVKAGIMPMGDNNDHVITISNLGMYGVTYLQPILNTPDSVIIGVGGMVKRPFYIGEGLFARDMLPLSLSFDHRIVDGGPAAAFLQEVCKELAALKVEE